MPDYRIALDPRNPGQYFACCGLFELAEVTAPGAQGGFEDSGATFVLETEASLPPAKLTVLPRVSLEGDPWDETLEPLALAIAGGEIRLNWWLNETLTGKSALKTWGGQQTPRRVLGELLRQLDYSTPLPLLFNAAVYGRSRFGVDPRSAWEALDAGYSPNDIGQEAITFPWVETLAVVGLQGFRPAERERTRYRYSAWCYQLPLVAARAACAAPWPGLTVQSFEFVVALRGQGYKTFLSAEGI
jgi:CRISPR-associated protein Csx14